MAELTYVCLYKSYLQELAPYTDAERGRLVMAMISYADTGEIPQFQGNEVYIWPRLQAQIDRDMKSYDDTCRKNRENGAKGGRPKKNRTDITETEGFSVKPKKAKEKENKKENKNDNEKEKESDTEVKGDKPPRNRFFPPSVEEVRAYCRERGNSVDPERFVDYYSANGWIVGKTKMKDWRAAVRTWEKSENNKSQEVKSFGSSRPNHSETKWDLSKQEVF